MADLRGASNGRPDAVPSTTSAGKNDRGSLSKATGPAAFGSAPRTARGTVARTPIVPKEHIPHRSQTTPVTSAEQHSRRGVVTNATLPPPKTDRKPSSLQPSSHAPEVDGRKLLAGTDYRIEPLSREQNAQWLSPSAPPMPSPDFKRQSGSSFQTEPSSYYSAEDNVASGPPPPMPEPQSFERRYESLWQAAQAPTMPEPETSLPSPYERESGYVLNSEDQTDPQNANVHDRQSSQHEPRDLYDSSWLAAPSSGTHAASASASPLPMPSARPRPPGEDMPEVNNRPSYRIENDNGEPTVGDNISQTAPLRIHHHHHITRPTATSGPSPAASSRPQAQLNIPHEQAANIPHRTQNDQNNTSNLGSQQALPMSRPTTDQRADFNQASVPAKSYGEQPTLSTPKPNISTSFTATNRPHPILQNSSRFDSNGPVQPKPTAATSTSSAAKPTSIYAQHATTRLDIPMQGNGAAKPSSTPASSTSRPTGTSAAPQNQTSQPTRPTGAGPSAFSTSVNSRPSQSQASNGRPHVTETVRPQAVSVPSPVQAKPQPKPSTPSSQMEDRKQAAAKASAAVASMPTRPHMHGQPGQMDTQYVNMMLALDDIPLLHNILVGFFNWILLAGFILFPGTFTSLANLPPDEVGAVGQKVIHSVTKLPLFIVAWICCGIGAGGMIWLWWRWRKNYLWGLNKIFLPGLMNSLAGLLSTLANIYGAQHGQFSTTSKATLIVTGASTAIFLIFAGFYSLWLVRRVKERHDHQVGKERAGKYGEGVVDVSTRKV